VVTQYSLPFPELGFHVSVSGLAVTVVRIAALLLHAGTASPLTAAAGLIASGKHRITAPPKNVNSVAQHSRCQTVIRIGKSLLKLAHTPACSENKQLHAWLICCDI
jgi:hypothetical protein